MKKNRKEKSSPDNQEIQNENTTEKQKKVFSQKQVVLISLLCAFIAAAVILSVVCVANDFNPFTYVASVVTNDEEGLIGKWQSQTSPGLTAYVFDEDGTYDSYISSFNFGGEYEVNGDKLILINPLSHQEVVYRYSVTGDTLSMTLIEENGAKASDSQTNKFDRVDSLAQKSPADLLGELKKNSEKSE